MLVQPFARFKDTRVVSLVFTCVLCMGWLAAGVLFQGCDRIDLAFQKKNKKKLQVLQGEITRLNKQNKQLREELSGARTALLEQKTKNAELIDRLEKNAFHVREINKTLAEYKNLEIKKNLLEQRIRELQTTLENQRVTIRELQEKIQHPPPPKEKPPRFRENECVQWYGSTYSEKLKMVGIVKQVRPNKVYLVRCVKSAMPYKWAEDEFYELPENVLDPCDGLLPATS